MWAQINKTQSTLATSISASSIDVASASDIKSLFWLIIDPFTTQCEIRQVVSITTPVTMNLSQPLKFAHAAATEIYITSSPIWDILLFAAGPNKDASTNTVAINAAVIDCNINGGGVVAIPKGEYWVRKYQHDVQGAIILEQFNNIKFVGEGMGVSIIKLAPGNGNGGDLHIFQCTSKYDSTLAKVVTCTHIEWHDLTLDGNRFHIYNEDLANQSHAIDVCGCSDFVVNNVEFLNTIGDGTRMYRYVNSAFNKELGFKNIQITNCRFISARRNGITGQTGTGIVEINGCYFYDTKNSDIDMEPTGSILIDFNSPNRWLITNNIFERNPANLSTTAISLTGKFGSKSEENYIVSGNIMRGVSMTISHCRNLILSNNTIISASMPVAKIPVDIINLADKLNIENNTIINNSLFEYAIRIFGDPQNDPEPDKVTTTKEILISGNYIEHGECLVEHGCNVHFVGNQVHQQGAGVGFRYRITSAGDPSNYGVTDFGNLVITDNLFSNVGEVGIKIIPQNPGWRLRLIHIDRNTIESKHLINGILIEKATPNIPFWEKLLIGTANIISAARKEQIVVYTPYQTANHDAQSNWVTPESPENNLEEEQGTKAINKDQVADNKFLKCTLTGSSGWMLQSELDRQVLFEDYFIPPGATDQSLTGSHVPEINVFDGLPPSIFPWLSKNPLDNWVCLGNGNGLMLSSLPSLGAKPWITYISSTYNGELKASFETTGNNGAFNSSGSIDIPVVYAFGIVFRYISVSSFWKLFVELPQGVATLRLETVGATSNPVALMHPVEIDITRKIELKVLLQDEFISVYFNDLLVWNLKNDFNLMEIKHGILLDGNDNTALIKNFKHLLH